MRHSGASLAVASLVWMASCTAGLDATSTIELDKAFSLKVGESRQTSIEGVRVAFEAVTADSRCPKDDKCVVAGRATVQVLLQRGTGLVERRELQTEPPPQRAVRLQGLELRLISLGPYPVSGSINSRNDYVATLVLSSAMTADLHR